MDTKDLKEYLSMVVDMEASCHLLKELREKLTRQLASIRDPARKTFECPRKPVEPEKKYKEQSAVVSVCLFVLYAIGTPFMMLLAEMFDPDFWSALLGIALLGIVFHPIIFIVLACLVLYGIGTAYDAIASKKSKERAAKADYEAKLKTYKQECETYPSKMKRYKEQVALDSQRVEKEAKIADNKRSFLKKSIVDLDKKYHESAKCLQELYDCGIIYPKYRGFIALCSIYEYICAGRCSTLGDAYNILEDEIKLNRIIMQLDRVIEQLTAIRANQYELFSAIQSNQRTLNSIRDQNEKILGMLDSGNDYDGQADGAASYYEERSEKEQKYKDTIDRFR